MPHAADDDRTIIDQLAKGTESPLPESVWCTRVTSRLNTMARDFGIRQMPGHGFHSVFVLQLGERHEGLATDTGVHVSHG